MTDCVSRCGLRFGHDWVRSRSRVGKTPVILRGCESSKTRVQKWLCFDLGARFLIETGVLFRILTERFTFSERSKGSRPRRCGGRLVPSPTDAGRSVGPGRRTVAAVEAGIGGRSGGLQRFLVRGLRTVKAVVLWFALAHNLMRAVALRAVAGGSLSSGVQRLKTRKRHKLGNSPVRAAYCPDGPESLRGDLARQETAE